MARFIVKDNESGKKYKGLTLNKASDKAKLDPSETNWAIQEHGKAETDTHSVRQQSRGKPFAFR